MGGPIVTLLPDDKPRRLPWWRRWRKAVLWTGGLGLVGLVGGWLFVSSAFFFRGIILPQIEKKLRAQITFEHVNWSPLNGVTLQGLVVWTTGDKPVFKAGELRLRARAWELGNGPKVRQLLLVDPVLHIAIAADGTSNFDSIREGMRSDGGGKAPDISDISIENGVFLYTRKDTTCALRNLSFTVSRWGNGMKGEVELAANVSREDGTNKLTGALTLAGNLTGSDNGWPSKFKGEVSLATKVAKGAYADWANISLRLESDLDVNALRQFQLTLTNGALSGTLRAQGNRESATGDWVLEVKTDDLARRVLLLAGMEPMGLIGDATINGNHTVRLNSGALTATGSFNVGTTRPAVQLTTDYKLTADYSERRALINNLALEGRQGQRVVLTGNLMEPLSVDWTQTGIVLGAAECELEIKRLNLPQWQAVLGHKLDAGTLDLRLQATTVTGSESVDYDLAATASRLHGTAFRWKFIDEDISLNAKGRLAAGRLTMHDSAVRHLARTGGASVAVSRLEELSLKWLTQPDKPAEGQLTASLSHTHGADQFSGHLSTQGFFEINPAGLLAEADANATVEIDVAEGIFADAQGLSGKARLNLAPGSLRELTVDFSRSGKAFGSVTVLGARDAPSGDWSLDCSVSGVDRRVLNLLGAGHDLDFRDTVLHSTNRIRFTPGGGKFAIEGRTTANQFSLARAGTVTPILNAATDYSLRLDWPAQQAEFTRLELSGVQNDQPVLTGHLLQPMLLAWGAAPVAEGESRLEFNLKDADVARWRPLFGDYAESGKVDATLVLTARQAGRELEYDWRSSVSGLTTPRFRELEVSLDCTGRLMDFSKLTVKECTARWRAPGGLEHSVGGSGTVEFARTGEVANAAADGWFKVEKEKVAGEYDGTFTSDTLSSTRRFKFNARKVPAPLLQRLHDKIQILTGTGSISGEIVENAAGTRIVKGYAEVAGLRLEHPEWPKAGADVRVDFEGFYEDSLDGKLRIDWKHANGSLTSAGKSLGEVNATGVVLLGPKEGQTEVALKQLKLTGIAPALLRLATGRALQEGVQDNKGEKEARIAYLPRLPWLDGTLDFEGELKWIRGDSLALKGKGVAMGLRLDTPNWPETRVNITVKGLVFLQPSKTDWRILQSGNLDGSVMMSGKAAGDFELAASVPGKFSVKMRSLEASLLRLAEPKWRAASGVVSGRINADVDVTLDSKTGVRFKGTGEVEDWVARNHRGDLGRLDNASAVFDISRHNDIFTLHDCRVDLGKSKLADNQVAVTGTYDFTQQGKIIGRIKARSESVELSRLFRVLKAEPNSGRPGGRSVQIGMELEAGRVHWRGLTATNFVATASVANKITEFSKMQMYLEGGPVGAYYRQDRSRPAWVHDLAIIGRQVSMPPLLDLFVDDRRKEWVAAQKWGRLDADFRMNWAQVPKTGWDWRAVNAEGLKGGGSDAVFRISGASIEVPKGDKSTGIVPDVLRMIVGAIARSLRVPELHQAKVETASIKGRIENKQVRARLKIQTPKYISEVGGKAPMQKRLPDTPLLGLPVECSLMPEVARKNRLAGSFFGGGKYLRLPVFCRLKGTLADVRVEIDPVVLGAIFTAGLSDTVINVPADVLEEASGVLDQLPVPVNPLKIFFPRKK